MEINLKTESIWEVEKKVNCRGAITIPAAIRRSMDLAGGDKFQVCLLASGDLLLKRLTGRCAFCGAPAWYKTAAGVFLCDNCKGKLDQKEGEADV